MSHGCNGTNDHKNMNYIILCYVILYYDILYYINIYIYTCVLYIYMEVVQPTEDSF